MKINNAVMATIITSFMMSSLVGCGAISASASDATDYSSMIIEDTEVIVDTDTVPSATDDALTPSESSTEIAENLEDSQFLYKGNVVSALGSFDQLDTELGGYVPDLSIQELYTYGAWDVKVFVYPKDGKKLPVTITSETDCITTSRNIKVGNTKDDVLAAYGDPNVGPPKAHGPDGEEVTGEAYEELFGEPLIYNLGDCQISFCIRNGKVSSITYQNNINHDQFTWS